MKKLYTLTLIFSLLSLGAFSQNSIANRSVGMPEDAIETDDSDPKNNPDFNKQKKFNNKLFGDTISYQQFRNGLPRNWSVVNNNANNFTWQWDTIYKQGQFSTTRNAIKSTTASNGFMSLPSDFYNTPTPTTGRVNMDTYFESNHIDLTNGGLNPNGYSSVWISYQQYVRYCCNASNRLVLQVSTDTFATFTEYDAINGLAVNAGNTSDSIGGTTNVINISTAVSGQTTCQYRFLAEGNGRYFWMIDDIAIIEGVTNDLELSNPYLEFHDAGYDDNPFYHVIPYDLFPPLPFFSTIKNNGSNTLTNVRLEVDVIHDSFPNTNAGAGLVYSNSTNTTPSTVVSNSISDSVINQFSNAPYFVPTILGDFKVDFLATSDSVDLNLGNETARQLLATSDTIFRKADYGLSGGTGPASYTRGGIPGGTAVGDRFGTMYIVESNTGNGLHTIPTSVTFEVSGNTRNDGVEIVPKIWSYNEDSSSVNASFIAEVASAFIPYTVTAANLNSSLTLSFDNGTALTSGLPAGQYVVGWEVTSIAGGTTFEVLEDASNAGLQETVTTFTYPGHSPGWGWVRDLPAIQLNMGNLPISTSLGNTSASSTEFNVLPNPNTGIFKLSIATENQISYNLNIRNTLGQLVYSDLLTINGKFTEQINLSKLEKGIYFVSLENESEKLMKKVIIQ